MERCSFYDPGGDFVVFCSSFKELVAEASAEETAAKEASDAKAEAEAEARRKEAAEKAKLQAAQSSMSVRFVIPPMHLDDVVAPALPHCQFSLPWSTLPTDAVCAISMPPPRLNHLSVQVVGEMWEIAFEWNLMSGSACSCFIFCHACSCTRKEGSLL